VPDLPVTDDEQNGQTETADFSHFSNDEYEVVKKLGAGGMATVYLARQITLDRPVALKVMSPRISQNASFKERFMREARTLAQFKHPNIITIYEVDTIDEQLFISMEYIDGKDLTFLMRKGLSVKQVLLITKQIAQALQYAHERDYVHRDIKPENVLFEKSGRLVLTDFGIARTVNEADTQLTQAGVSLGTPAYMAPEQFESSQVDHRADLYSLGVMMFQMLAGKRPYSAATTAAMLYQHAAAPIPQLPEKLKSLQPVVNKLLAKKPGDRLKSARQLARVIDRYLGNKVTEEALLTSVQTEQLDIEPDQEKQIPNDMEESGEERSESKGASSKLPLYGIAAAAVLALAAGAFWLYMGQEGTADRDTVVAITPEPPGVATPAADVVTPSADPITNDDTQPRELLLEPNPAPREFIGTNISGDQTLSVRSLDPMAQSYGKILEFTRSEDTPIVQKLDVWTFFITVYRLTMPTPPN
jgi:serine/threonine protein kinase|tara:strand:- start:3853 stop:5271 length:1419 start_codon:yes stop_codon:yes gene_type:complete